MDSGRRVECSFDGVDIGADELDAIGLLVAVVDRATIATPTVEAGREPRKGTANSELNFNGVVGNQRRPG